MKTMLAAAACLLFAVSANAAEIDGETLSLIGAENMTVVSDADGAEIRGQGRSRNRHSTPVIFQKETVKSVDFSYSSSKVSYTKESKSVSFSYLSAEKVTFIKGFGF